MASLPLADLGILTVPADLMTSNGLIVDSSVGTLTGILGNTGVTFSPTMSVPTLPGNSTEWLRSDNTWEPLPLATIANSGAVPALNAASGSGQQGHVWLRGDDTWMSLPEYSYTSSAFTVPAIGSTVSVNLYTPAPGWPNVGGMLYFSDGTNRGFLNINSYNSVTAVITAANLGNATASQVVAAGATVRLTAVPPATATAAGLVPTPPNSVASYLAGNATWTAFQQWLQLSPLNAPVSPTAWDDEFLGSTLNASKWTASASGYTTGQITVGGSNAAISIPGTAASGSYVQFTQLINSISTGNFEFMAELKFCGMLIGSSSGSVNLYFGISGGGVSLCLQMGISGATPTVQNYLQVTKGVQTTGGANISGTPSYICDEIPRFVKIGRSGTAIYIQVSMDGSNFLPIYSETYSSGPSFGGATITSLVLGYYQGVAAGNSQGQVSTDFIRRTV
jgi:hypothetical protein